MSPPQYVGIDIGTSAVKALVIDGNQREISSASVPLTTDRRQPRWAEQDPEQWWAAVVSAVTELLDQEGVKRKAIRGIGLTGQMHGAVLLDGSHRPVRPAILWNDGRAEKEAERLQRDYPHLAEINGVLPMPGLTAPKLLWLWENEPETREQTRFLLLPKDYVRLRLTGELVTDYSDAAGTWLFDQYHRCWSDEAVEAAGLSMSSLPAVTESTEVSGVVSEAAAAYLGLAPGIPVAGGGGDTPAGAVGFGCTRPGEAVISLGTSAHVFTPTKKYVPAVESMVHSFCHALPSLWYQMGAMLNGASTLQWACSLLGRDLGEMECEVRGGYTGPGELLFLPYLAGERTPHNDARAKGVFFGLTPDTAGTDLCQSILEGVAYSLADGRDCLQESGTAICSAAIGGGGAKSRLWAQIIASVLDIPIIRYKGKERGPAFGAARLGVLAAEGGSLDEMCTAPDIEEVLEPDPDHVGQYRENHERFRRLYRLLRSEFRS